MHYSIITEYEPEFPLDNTSWIDNLFGIVFDITCFFFLSILITKGNNFSSYTITYFSTLIWAFCNIIYSRFFHSYITLSAIGQSASIFDPIVISSTLQGFCWRDLYFIISFLFFFILYKNRSHIRNLKLTKIPFSAFTILLFANLIAHAIYCFSVPEYRYLSYYEYRFSNRHFNKLYCLCEPRRTTFHRGAIRTLSVEAIDILKGPIELTEHQRNLIKETTTNTKGSMGTNHHKNPNIENVIFIIIESYMSFVSDLLIDNKEITPYLNGLRHDHSVYFNGQVKPNITLGESADGQYIYMTGLLPLRSVITISKAQSRVLPGLPKILKERGMESRMIIPTQPSLWNQSTMCNQYGFEHLFSCNTFTKEYESYLTDQQIFDYAASIDNKSSENFFSVILTMSMHQPYNNIIDDSFIIGDPTISKELKCYLNACHYMDKYLGNYIEGLKKNNIYQHSLIIITSDHHVHNTSFGININNDIPLYIINGGFDANVTWHGSCNQIDIYPTILDIMDLRPQWCGIGHSLLSADYSESLDETKWEMSEWILQSDYFNVQQK